MGIINMGAALGRIVYRISPPCMVIISPIEQGLRNRRFLWKGACAPAFGKEFPLKRAYKPCFFTFFAELLDLFLEFVQYIYQKYEK
jgi:hypothetical protein